MTLQTFCPNCGTALVAGAEFCGSCGYRVSGGSPATASAATGAEYAGFWIRFLAVLIDTIIVAFVGGLIAFVIFAFVAVALGLVLYFLLPILYYAWGNGSGGTFGKQIVGIRVVSLQDGEEIGFGSGLGRAVIWWLGSLPLYLGWLWMLWNPQKQTWHDKAVGSIVVKARP